MFAALSDTNEAIMRVATPQDLYQRVCEAAVRGGRLLGGQHLCARREFGGRAYRRGCRRERRELARCAVFDRRMPRRKAADSSARRFARNALHQQRLTRTMSAPRTGTHRRGRPASRAGAALPLVQHGRTIGVSAAALREQQAFDDEIVQLLMHMGRNVVFALDNFKRESEREAAEEQLRATDARLKRATRGANDGLWELDVASREMWVSPHFAEMFGL